MATAYLTRSKIKSYSHSAILDILNQRSNIDDPKRSGNTTQKRDFIFDTLPLHKAYDFSLFPYLYIQFPKVSYRSASLDGKYKFIGFVQKLIVRTARRGSSNSDDDLGKTDMLNITDDIHETFNSEQTKAILRALNLYKIEIVEDAYDEYVVEGKDVFETNYTISYETRLQVSA